MMLILLHSYISYQTQPGTPSFNKEYQILFKKTVEFGWSGIFRLILLLAKLSKLRIYSTIFTKTSRMRSKNSSKNTELMTCLPERQTRSRYKKCATETSKSKKSIDTSSKRTETLINPRVARRMKKINEVAESNVDKCAICLSNTQEQFGSLQCGHTFCMPCLTRWWRHHPTCPCCREQIMFIMNSGKYIYFYDLPPQEIDQNQPFIAHCELCWGEVQPHEEMNICTVCRSVYWHSRCLPFKSTKWYCAECAGDEEEDE